MQGFVLRGAGGPTRGGLAGARAGGLAVPLSCRRWPPPIAHRSPAARRPIAIRSRPAAVQLRAGIQSSDPARRAPSWRRRLPAGSLPYWRMRLETAFIIPEVENEWG